MFAQYFNLPALPFEVLLCVFEFLDRKDLPSICLASKVLNSVATPLLYRNVTCRLGQSNPIHWFKASVDLTLWSPTHFTAVRYLGLCGCWVRQRQPDLEHYKSLVNVRGLNLVFPRHKCSYTPLDDLNAQPIVRHLFGLRLRELSIRSFLDLVGTRDTFRTIKRLHSRHSMGLERFAKFDLPLLEYLNVVFVRGRVDLHILSTFKSLRTLILRTCNKFRPMTSLLDVLSSLPHLHTFHHQSLSRYFFEKESTRPTDLRNLRDLSLSYCSLQMSGEGQDEIVRFLDLLAGTSQLERLKLQVMCKKPIRYKGEVLLSWIFRKHMQTISVLRLPNYYPPLALLQRLFRTPNLRKLAIGINTTTLNHLDRFLATAPVLEELSMVFSSHDIVFWYEQAKALLHQCVDSRVHLIKTVRTIWYDRTELRCRKVAYRTRWKYDPPADQPLRYVERSEEYVRTLLRLDGPQMSQ